MWHDEVFHGSETGNNQHHVGSRNHFSHWPHLRCPSLYGLSPGLSEFGSRSRVAVATIGAIGVGIGVFAFCKGSKIAGTVCFLTNIPVFAYYGFHLFSGGSACDFE